MTQEELKAEERVIRELKELLLQVLVDDPGHTILVSWSQNRCPKERLKSSTYRLSTAKGSFEIKHLSSYSPEVENT